MILSQGFFHGNGDLYLHGASAGSGGRKIPGTYANKKQARIGDGTVSELLSCLRRSRVYPRYLAGSLWNSAFKKTVFKNLKFENVVM